MFFHPNQEKSFWISSKWEQLGVDIKADVEVAYIDIS